MSYLGKHIEHNDLDRMFFTDRNGLTLCRESIRNIVFYEGSKKVAELTPKDLSKFTDQRIYDTLSYNELSGRTWIFSGSLVKTVKPDKTAGPSPLL